MNIYCGNLSYDCTDTELRQAFEAHGEVESAHVVTDKYSGRSRGFGFVVMPNEGEAQTAIQALNGHELMGRPLKVNEARSQERRQPGEGPAEGT